MGGVGISSFSTFPVFPVMESIHISSICLLGEFIRSVAAVLGPWAQKCNKIIDFDLALLGSNPQAGAMGVGIYLPSFCSLGPPRLRVEGGRGGR